VFSFQDTRGRFEVAFTDRHGGVSDGPYATLNLGFGVGDDRGSVEENLRRVTAAFTRRYDDQPAPASTSDRGEADDRRPVLMQQVHGGDVHVVHEGNLDADPVRADALVTNVPGVPLVVRIADCVPVLLADVAAGVVAAAHAGRPGMVAGVVANTVAAMRSLGANSLVGWIGPHVCGACYEVPEEMRAEVSAMVPAAHATTSWGTPALDIGAGVRSQLAALDVAVLDASRCTLEDEELFSYRRAGKASGRLAGLVWVRP
jgi:polyphenol oxidase